MVRKIKTAEIFKLEKNRHKDHIGQLSQNGRIGQKKQNGQNGQIGQNGLIGQSDRIRHNG